MVDKLWKKVERHVATALHGKRVPILGRAGRADVECEYLLAEVKERQDSPFAQWVYEGLAQASLAHQNDDQGRLPLVWVHHKGNDHRDDIVLMRASAFEELYSTYCNMKTEIEEALTEQNPDDV